LATRKTRYWGDEPETAAVLGPVLDVKVPEAFLAHDGEVGEAQPFFKGRKRDLRDVAIIHVNLEVWNISSKKVASSLSMESWLSLKAGDEK
jgi:hypothetical protein